MKQNKLFASLALITLLSLFAVGAVVMAQSSAGFNLSWHVIGNGGGQSSSADYQLNGTIGQSTSGGGTFSSAGFAVNGGYWTGDSGAVIYLPAIMK